MYNGHKNWSHWNVALWVCNDEGLYRLACTAIRYAGTLDEAAHELLVMLPEKTPDGAVYSFSSVRAALRDWR